MAQQTPPQPDGPMAEEDPRTKYPKPPFPEQTQPWPGLAGKMTPKPAGPATERQSGHAHGGDQVLRRPQLRPPGHGARF